MRRMIGVLVALALSAGVIALWPRSEPDSPSVTEGAAATTTTTTEPTPTSTSVNTTTTAPPDERPHVVETVEEAETILRDLWFGWFEGIYNQDEDRIREVVVLEDTVDTARESFGVMEFSRAPTRDLVNLSDLKILRSDDQCLGVWGVLDVSAFRPATSGTSGLYVLRWVHDAWSLLSVWTYQDDLWGADCESQLG